MELIMVAMAEQYYFFVFETLAPEGELAFKSKLLFLIS